MVNRYGISNVYVCMVDFCMTAGFDSPRTSDRCGGSAPKWLWDRGSCCQLIEHKITIFS